MNLGIKSFKTKNKYKWIPKENYRTVNSFSGLVENDINKVKSRENKNINTQSIKKKARSYGTPRKAKRYHYDQFR